MSSHKELRLAETSVLEAAISFVASRSWRIPTNLRRVSVDAEHFEELGQACITLVQHRMDLDGDGAHNCTDTSIIASKLPGKASLRRQVLNLLLVQYGYHGDGLTTAEVEERLKRKHQSVSSAMNFLAERGLVGDSGLRRRSSIVYAPTELARRLAHAEQWT